MNKFGRRIQIRLGDREYDSDNIDIDFKYDFDDSLENNVSEISIWNVSEDTINSMKKGTTVSVLAGYNEDVGTILVGKVGDFEVIPHRVDSELKLYVSDGVNLWGNKITKTYENIKADAVVKDLLFIVGVSVGKIQVENNILYKKLVVNQSLDSILKKIAKDTNSKFYLKNTKGYFVNKNYADKTIVQLDEDSGLLGSPSRQTIDKKIGWSVSCMLEHRISVGSHIRIISKTANGDFRVVKGSHDSDFTTRIEVLKL